MLYNAHRFDKKIDCYEMGLGYVFELSARIQIADLGWILENFTNMSNLSIAYHRLFKKDKIEKIIKKIMDINFGEKKSDGETPGGGIEEAFFSAIDLLMAEYGLSPDYILENITLRELKNLRTMIEKRKIHDAHYQALAYHDPKKLRKQAKEVEGTEEISMTEAMRRLNKKNRERQGI